MKQGMTGLNMFEENMYAMELVNMSWHHFVTH
jgi:hypothetical protein